MRYEENVMRVWGQFEKGTVSKDLLEQLNGEKGKVIVVAAIKNIKLVGCGLEGFLRSLEECAE